MIDGDDMMKKMMKLKMVVMMATWGVAQVAQRERQGDCAIGGSQSESAGRV